MPGRYSDSELGSMGPKDLARAIGEAWYGNDVETFVSLFEPEARIKHPLFDGEVPPRTAADVLNGLVKPTGLLGEPEVVPSARPLAGQHDEVVDMSFVEAVAGRPLSENSPPPQNSARITMTAGIRNNRFSYLDVHGFRVE